MEEQKNNGPIAQARQGSISLAVFDGVYGKSGVLQKSYLRKGGDAKNKDDWVRTQTNLFLNEIENLKIVVDEIYNTCKADIDASKKKE